MLLFPISKSLRFNHWVSLKRLYNFSKWISSSEKLFVQSAQRLTSSGKLPPSQEVSLKLYSFYKQAKEGPCTVAEPSIFDPVARAKYRAWKELNNMDKELAMQEYINLVETIIGEKLSETKMIPLHEDSLSKVAFPDANYGETSTVLSDVQDHIATVTMNRPDTLNAFNMKMWREMSTVFDNLTSEKGVRVAILTGGSPRSFSTGMDLTVFMELQSTLASEPCEGRKREGLSNVIQFLQDAVSAPERCRVPVIAAVSGFCIGGAVDLITACDLRYCTADATFSIKETDLAMVADIGTLQRLPKLIGDQRARELAYTGRTFGGKEAAEMGLVLQCFDTYGDMMNHVRSVARDIASKSPLTIRGVKQTLLYSRDNTVANSLNQVKLWNAAYILSDDLEIAAKATMKKEKPQFKGN